MEKRMDFDEEFQSKYHEKILEDLQKGFARQLSPGEAAVEDSNPKKLRFVFDAAAKANGLSLNDKFLKGPDQWISLPGMLMKFHHRRVGVTADIQDMCHHVKLMEEDRCVQRVYVDDGCPIFDSHALVDDCLDSCDSVQKASVKQMEVKEICEKRGFNLYNWISSSKEVMAVIPESLRAASHRNLDMEVESNVERVLGLFWIPEKDKFTFSLNFVKLNEEILTGKRLPTKREFLSLLMTIYDPLRFVTNFSVKAKFILQATRIESLSILRLELQATLLGFRMAQFIRDAHDVKVRRTTYWSDNRTVLCWLKSEGRRYQAFVAHRVGEIQELTKPSEWRWESTADKVTRLESATDFGQSSHRVHGPDFLKLGEEKWANLPAYVEDVPERELEPKKDFVGVVAAVPDPLTDYNKYIAWSKLVGSIAVVFRFVGLESDQVKLGNECGGKGVEWKFIPPAAHHMGGSWERLVKLVKVALHSIMKERCPTDEVLQTFIVEAQHMVNSRPLTHVSIDPEERKEFSPNHFLLGSSSNVQRPGEFNASDFGSSGGRLKCWLTCFGSGG